MAQWKMPKGFHYCIGPGNAIAPPTDCRKLNDPCEEKFRLEEIEAMVQRNKFSSPDCEEKYRVFTAPAMRRSAVTSSAMQHCSDICKLTTPFATSISDMCY